MVCNSFSADCNSREHGTIQFELRRGASHDIVLYRRVIKRRSAGFLDADARTVAGKFTPKNSILEKYYALPMEK